MPNKGIVELVRCSREKLTNKTAIATKTAAALPHTRAKLDNPILLASDGFIPFTDNIELASRYGVQVVLEPEGAKRSTEIEKSVVDCGMTLVRSERRFLFH